MTGFSFNLSDFVLVWWGLLFEAMPFVILSGVVERCVSRETVVRFFPKNRYLGIVASACLGLIFPMCECGVVPVVRRLVRKGVPVSCGITYMLAAPIVNPLVMPSDVPLMVEHMKGAEEYDRSREYVLRVGKEIGVGFEGSHSAGRP